MSVATAVADIGACDVLVNNAGGAIGAETVENGRPQDWRDMYESNVLGILHVTQAFLPLLRRSSEGGTVVVVSSIAGLAVYEGGAGYTAAKHARPRSPRRCGWSCPGSPSASSRSTRGWSTPRASR